MEKQCGQIQMIIFDIVSTVRQVILDFYYENKGCIFWGIGLFMAAVCVLCLIVKSKKEGVKYIVNHFVHLVFVMAFICFVGEILYQFQLYPRVCSKYFNWSLFFIPFVGIVAYELIQMFIFKKIVLPFCMLCKYIRYLLIIELFWLALTGYLQLSEFIAGTVATCLISYLMITFKKAEYNSDAEKLKKETGHPNTELYPTRRSQLNSFISILNEYKDEPYAIMISGEWGSGKTSFVKALEQEQSKDVFIWIQAGSGKTAAHIMQDISKQIISILKTEGVFIEEDELINQYFLAFAHTIVNAGKNTIDNLLDIIQGKEKRDSKEYLNSKLKELKKTIYLVVDDLDRCDREYQKKMFQVIRESTDLRHCKPLFLVDKKQFINEDLDINYIEKYVSYCLDLCPVEFDEILGYDFLNIFSEELFSSGVRNFLLRYGTPGKIKERIRDFPKETLKTCEEEIKRREEELRKNNSDQIGKKRIDNDRVKIEKIKKNIINPRKVKNYLKSIKRGILQLNQGINMCKGEYREADWLEVLIAVKFTEHFLPEEYWEIKTCGSVTRWQQQEPDHIANIILDIGNPYTIGEEKKRYLVEQLVFRIGTINFEAMHTEEEMYLLELRDDRGKINCINKYIEYAQDYNDLKKIIDIVSKENFSVGNKLEFFEDILTCLSREYNRFAPKDRAFYDFSKQMIDFLCKAQLSDKEKTTCIYYGDHIVERAIIENTYIFRNILLLLCNPQKVEEHWGSSIINIDEFSAVLQKIDEDRFCKRYGENGNEIECIRLYYNGLRQELMDDKYKSVADRFIPQFDRINIVLDIWSLWESLESILEEAKSDSKSVLENYFILAGGYTYKEDIFVQSSEFVEALKQLKVFYEQQSEESYDPNMSRILLHVLYKAVGKFVAQPKWFEGYCKEISELFECMAERVYSIDKQKNDYDENVVQQILLYTYQFKNSINML